MKELQQLIGWKSEKEFWWEGKYILTLIHIPERMVMCLDRKEWGILKECLQKFHQEKQRVERSIYHE